MMRLGLHAIQTHGTVEPGDMELPVRLRAELGVRPNHEVVYLIGKVPHTVDTWRLLRAQESTATAAWPVATPLAFTLSTDEPDGERTAHLAFALSAGADEVNLHNAYRRLQIDAEIVHTRQLLGDDAFTPYPTEDIEVSRGMESTTAAAHAAGAAVVWLGPES